MVLPRVGVGGLLHGAYNYTGCYPRQVVFRRRSIRATGSEPTVFPDRLPRGQQVITSHLLFRIIPQHVAVFQPRIDPLCRERQISYQSERLCRGLGVCWEVASRFFSIFQPSFNLSWPCPTECGCSPSTTLAFQRLADFAVFGRCEKVTFQLHLRAAENSRNRPRLSIRAVTVFRGRALAVICDNLQDTYDPSASATSETRQTRDLGL